MSGTAVLQVMGMTKAFPGVVALQNVSLDVRPGEIHAVVGENGAGKSTLMNCLTGVHQPDAGEILLDGTAVRIDNPRHAQELGIGIVHQELSLCQNLDVAENIFVGRVPRTLRFFTDFRRMQRDARTLLARVGLPIDPRTPVGTLSVAAQQLVEIAKAFSFRCKLLILDEPTSALTERETENLFRQILQLRAEGTSILYISHRLHEIAQIADRATVLRDGHKIGTVDMKATPVDDLIRMMVGRTISALYPEHAGKVGRPLLEVRGFRRAGVLNNVTFALRRGEILGIAGLIGAGRTELARALFGIDPIDGGELLLNGRTIGIHSVDDAMHHGIAYLPEDRKQDGLFLRMSVQRNIVVTRLKELARLSFIVARREREMANEQVRHLRIKTSRVDQEVGSLSGGNQQKVMLARWLSTNPQVLIADEPTRGIDIGAKAEVYALFRRLTAEGIGVIFISSELPEVLGISDRILVMHEGAMVGEFAAADASEERIMASATGSLGLEPGQEVSTIGVS